MHRILFIFDGAYAYSPRRFNTYQIYSEDLTQIPNSTLNVINKEKRRVSYTPLLDLIYNSSFTIEHELFYSAQTSICRAKNKIHSLKPDVQYSIDIVGYSWGADAAVRFIKFLKSQNIKVNKVYTLDPIRRGPLFLGFIKSIKGNLNYFNKETNVAKHFNVYQKTDKYSLPLIHLRGNRVLGADYNFNLSDKYLDASHVNLHLFDEVKGFLDL